MDSKAKFALRSYTISDSDFYSLMDCLKYCIEVDAEYCGKPKHKIKEVQEKLFTQRVQQLSSKRIKGAIKSFGNVK